MRLSSPPYKILVPLLDITGIASPVIFGPSYDEYQSIVSDTAGTYT
jgi:hypothetical protein